MSAIETASAVKVKVLVQSDSNKMLEFSDRNVLPTSEEQDQAAP